MPSDHTGSMTTQTHDFRSSRSTTRSPLRSLAALRAARRANRAALAADTDVARRLPGYPTSHRAGYAVSLLADGPRQAV